MFEHEELTIDICNVALNLREILASRNQYLGSSYRYACGFGQQSGNARFGSLLLPRFVEDNHSGVIGRGGLCYIQQP